MFKVETHETGTNIYRQGAISAHAATIMPNRGGSGWESHVWGAFTGKGRQTNSGWVTDEFPTRMEAEVHARRELKIL